MIFPKPVLLCVIADQRECERDRESWVDEDIVNIERVVWMRIFLISADLLDRREN